MNLTEIAVKRPSLIIVIFMVLILGGLWSYSSLKYELVPDFSEPTIIVTTAYPGASPLQVEQNVSTKIEEALSSLKNVNSISTQSYEGVSLVIVNFISGTDIKYSEQVAQRAIANKYSTMPQEAKQSVIKRISPSDAPVIQLVVGSEALSEEDLYDLLEDEMRPRIERITGVSEVNFIGGREREVQVNVNQAKLESYGLSIMETIQAIRRNNVDFPSGKVRNEHMQSSIRVVGRVSSLSDLRSIQINQMLHDESSPILIGDVAEVIEVAQEPKAIVRLNKKPGIAIVVKRQLGSNAVDISSEVRTVAAQMESMYSDSKLSVYVADDMSQFTIDSADAVTFDLLLAIVLVALIILLFLHSLRDAFIVMVSIPASLISTFIAMYALGYTLNLMTLLAMSLVVGILVDDSIVILENIHRHLGMKKSKSQAAIDGRKEIGFTAVAITLVDVVVFAPIIFLESMVADLLRQYSVVVVVSTLMSLFVSFTLTPWLASRISKSPQLNPRNLWHQFLMFFEKQIAGMTRWYVHRLEWSLRHKWLTLFAILGAFVLTGYIMSMGILGREMVSMGDQGKYRIALEFDKGTSLQRTNLRSQSIENDILAHPLVASVFANVGGPSTSGNLATLANLTDDTKSEILVNLIPFSERTQSTETIMRQTANVLKEKYHGVKIESVLVGFRAIKPIEIVLQSTDRGALSVTADKIERLISTTKGAINVERSVDVGNPELVLQVDREKMNQMGIDASTLGANIRSAVNGNDDLMYLKQNNEYHIVVKSDLSYRQEQSDVVNMTIKNNQGELIPISSFCRFEQNQAPSMLERKNRISSVTLKSDVLGTTSGVLASSISKAIDTLDLPSEVSWKWGGEIERQDEVFGALGLALLASLILVYLIMVALYDSFLHPFIVLFSIPVALIGALIALNLAADSMSIFTMLGIMMLLGLVSKNGILLVDYTNQVRERGYDTRKALLEAGHVRLRPILMTTISMVLGMLPIALATGASAEWKNGLGVVMIGGLLSSLMLTIFLVPIIYEITDNLRMFLKRNNQQQKAS